MCFEKDFNVVVNWDLQSSNKIGIAVLIKKNFKIEDKVIGVNGRIIGIKLRDIQIWNVYPQSGSIFKKDRESFFTEMLCNYMVLWKDQSKFIFQGGDHNCIHRKEDCRNNQSQHLHQGLERHIKNSWTVW